MSKLWVIYSANEDGYWSNNFGWVDEVDPEAGNNMIFTDSQKKSFNLPLGDSKWVQYKYKNPMRKGCSQKTKSSNIADMIAGRKGHRKRSVKQASAIAYKFAREQGCPLPKNYLKQNPAIADHFERLYHLGKAIAFDLVEKIVEPTMEETRNFYYKSIGSLIGSGDIYSELEQEMVLEGFLHALSKDHKD